ncbi:hypothetical protein ACU686_03950 [Yinghuangia aomiensis]
MFTIVTSMMTMSWASAMNASATQRFGFTGGAPLLSPSAAASPLDMFGAEAAAGVAEESMVIAFFISVLRMGGRAVPEGMR